MNKKYYLGTSFIVLLLVSIGILLYLKFKPCPKDINKPSNISASDLEEINKFRHCEENFAKTLHAFRKSGKSNIFSYLKTLPDFNVHDITSFRVGKNKLGLFIVFSSKESPGSHLAWYAHSLYGPIIQFPLTQSGIDVGDCYDFIHVEQVGDFDTDNNLDSLVISTGGAGMYFHKPFFLKLENNKWKILCQPGTFFYGSTEVITNDNHQLQFAIESVDKKAPWLFGDFASSPHPFKHEVYRMKNGKPELLSTMPVPDKLFTISNVILALQEGNLSRLEKYLTPDAVLGDIHVRSKNDLEIAKKKLHLETSCSYCKVVEEENGDVKVSEIQGRHVAILPSHYPKENIVTFKAYKDVGKSEERTYTAVFTSKADNCLMLKLELLK
jgi:hypothetical protein